MLYLLSSHELQLTWKVERLTLLLWGSSFVLLYYNVITLLYHCNTFELSNPKAIIDLF